MNKDHHKWDKREKCTAYLEQGLEFDVLTGCYHLEIIEENNDSLYQNMKIHMWKVRTVSSQELNKNK